MQALFRPLSSKRLIQNLPFVSSKHAYQSHNNSDCLEHYQMEGGTLIRASFTGLGNMNKSLLKQDKFFVPISVKQKYHYGTQFAATLSLLNEYAHSCVFNIADTLQAYSRRIFYPNAPMSELLKLTEREGDNWITENYSLLSKLKIPWKIIRWNSILEHPDFSYYFEIVEKTYYTNPALKAACDKNIKEYLDRNPGYPTTDEQAKEFGLKYILIECAAMFIWLDERCQWEVYPNGRKGAMQKTYEILIQPKHPNDLKPLGLKYKKVHNYMNGSTQEEPKKDAQHETNYLREESSRNLPRECLLAGFRM